jgi:hypothetical protein
VIGGSSEWAGGWRSAGDGIGGALTGGGDEEGGDDTHSKVRVEERREERERGRRDKEESCEEVRMDVIGAGRGQRES